MLEHYLKLAALWAVLVPAPLLLWLWIAGRRSEVTPAPLGVREPLVEDDLAVLVEKAPWAAEEPPVRLVEKPPAPPDQELELLPPQPEAGLRRSPFPRK